MLSITTMIIAQNSPNQTWIVTIMDTQWFTVKVPLNYKSKYVSKAKWSASGLSVWPIFLKKNDAMTQPKTDLLTTSATKSQSKSRRRALASTGRRSWTPDVGAEPERASSSSLHPCRNAGKLSGLSGELDRRSRWWSFWKSRSVNRKSMLALAKMVHDVHEKQNVRTPWNRAQLYTVPVKLRSYE